MIGSEAESMCTKKNIYCVEVRTGMTVLMVACSRRAYTLMKRLEADWRTKDHGLTTVCLTKCKSLPEVSVHGRLSECVGEWIGKVDVVIFFCAAGIAVRTIAPYLKHKSVDPAVVVIDEAGKFCISLLSGHAGGANELTGMLAEMLGAVPVITTATDREGKFSVDDFARKNDLIIASWDLAKQISVDVLEGKDIWLYSDWLIEGECPEEVQLSGKRPEDFWKAGQTDREKQIPEDCLLESMLLESEERKVFLSAHVLPEEGLRNVLQLIPKRYVIGIGCRRGTGKEQIAAAVEELLREEGLLPEAVSAIASIDLKQKEEGLVAYCREKKLPFLTYSAGLLKRVEGTFSESEFVEQVTGVSCVCERSAVIAAQGELLCRKRIYHGVTVALAEKKGSITF